MKTEEIRKAVLDILNSKSKVIPLYEGGDVNGVDFPNGWRGKKYNVLTGLVHSYCKPYRTNDYWKALIALLWRKIWFGRGYIIRSW